MAIQTERAPLGPGSFAIEASSGLWEPAPHLQLLNKQLIRVAAGQLNRLAVAIPPRHGKSEFISRYFPAWYMGMFPYRKVILASYEGGLAASWARRPGI